MSSSPIFDVFEDTGDDGDRRKDEEERYTLDDHDGDDSKPAPSSNKKELFGDSSDEEEEEEEEDILEIPFDQDAFNKEWEAAEKEWEEEEAKLRREAEAAQKEQKIKANARLNWSLTIANKQKELFGDSSDDDDDDNKEIPFDQDAFDKEWEVAEREWEEEEAKLRREVEAAQKERQRKADARSNWRLTIANKFQKHPPRGIGLEARAKELDDDEGYHYYCFRDEYPSLFRSSQTRIGDLLRGHYGHNERLSKLKAAKKQIQKLPCSALQLYDEDGEKDDATENTRSSFSFLPHKWTPEFKAVMEGVREEDKKKNRKRSHGSDETICSSSPLVVLRDHESTLLRHIFSFLAHYGHHITMTIPADIIMNSKCWGGRMERMGLGPSSRRRKDGSYGGLKTWDKLSSDNSCYAKGSGYVAFSKVGQVLDLFPSSCGRNVNMMPFILGDPDSLPEDLRCYYPLIDACPFYRDEFGKIAYLTVHETNSVDQNATQRRSGIHIESPGVFADSDSTAADSKNPTCGFTPGEERHHWGLGSFGGPDRYEGGIYMASNVDNTTALWDALVDSSIPGIVDRHGGVVRQELKRYFPDSAATKLKAGELVWMTDCTPHEALPQPNAGPRTFFRLVMPYVTHWYAANSTQNPKVSITDNITVIDDCKFAAAKTSSKSHNRTANNK